MCADEVVGPGELSSVLKYDTKRHSQTNIVTVTRFALAPSSHPEHARSHVDTRLKANTTNYGLSTDVIAPVTGTDVGLGATAKRALDVADASVFVVPANADAFTVELANADLDVVFKFRSGGVSGTVLKTVTITYANTQVLAFTSGTIT